MPVPFLSLTDSNLLTSVGDFIVAVTGIEVVQGQDNRVAEPTVSDFAVMWPTLRERLETNVTSYQDITLTGHFATTTLTVTAISGTPLQIGSPVFGIGVAANTYITALGTGVGGLGTYTVSQSQTLPSQPLQAGLVGETSPMRVTVQIDVHGPSSTDNTQRLVTLFRDEYGTDFFAAYPWPVAPLYIDDGSQVPFVNGEGQYEDRWVLQAKLQINPTVSTPQQFAQTLTPAVIPVDVAVPIGGIYPADVAFVATSALTNYTAHMAVSYGASPQETMDIFVPPSGTPTGAVVMFHGGGWTAGAANALEPGTFSFENNFVGAFANAGIAVFNANYVLHTTTGDWSAVYGSVQAALAFANANASTYNVKASAIGVLGNSAGAQLAGMLGVTGQAAFLVDNSGPMDMSAPSNLATTIRDMIGTSTGALHAASPLYNIGAGTVPAFISHGLWDGNVPISQSQAFYAALQAAGIPVQFVTYLGEHVFLGTLLPECWSILHREVTWAQGLIAGL